MRPIPGTITEYPKSAPKERVRQVHKSVIDPGERVHVHFPTLDPETVVSLTARVSSVLGNGFHVTSEINALSESVSTFYVKVPVLTEDVDRVLNQLSASHNLTGTIVWRAEP